MPLHPPVLLMRIAPVELEEHPEAAAVDRLVPVALAAELLERRGGDERDVAPPTVDGEARVRLDQSERTAEPGGERSRPRALDGVAWDGPVVEVGRDFLAEYDPALGDRSVRKAQCKPL